MFYGMYITLNYYEEKNVKSILLKKKNYEVVLFLKLLKSIYSTIT